MGLNNFYSGQGLYAIAEPWCKECVSVLKSRLGENHPDYALSLNNLAFLYHDQGKYEQAEPLYIHALEIAELVLGANHPRTVAICRNLEKLRTQQQESGDNS